MPAPIHERGCDCWPHVSQRDSVRELNDLAGTIIHLVPATYSRASEAKVAPTHPDWIPLQDEWSYGYVSTPEPVSGELIYIQDGERCVLAMATPKIDTETYDSQWFGVPIGSLPIR